MTFFEISRKADAEKAVIFTFSDKGSFESQNGLGKNTNQCITLSLDRLVARLLALKCADELPVKTWVDPP